MKKTIEFQSLCVREIKENRTTDPHVLPIYATSSFDFKHIDQGINIFRGDEKGHVYSRFGNPTVEAVAEKIASLEAHNTGKRIYGLFCSSGMAAILTLVLALMKKGDKILTQGNLYGGTTELFSDVLTPLGIEVVRTDLKDMAKVEKQLDLDRSIKMIFGESPANPTLACLDLVQISAICKKHGIWSVIDNTFCTPYLQQPFLYDIDFVIHSTTKYLNGHGNSTAGIILGSQAELMQKDVWKTMKLAGTNSNAFDAWLVNQGLKTLALRMEKHCSNAQQLAEFLEKHHIVQTVNYPGLLSHPDHSTAKRQMREFGGMLSFELKGGLEKGLTFMRKIRFCTLAPTMGDVDTLILHPASMSHFNVPKEIREKNGITDGLIRVSVGIEDIRDIISDIETALEE